MMREIMLCIVVAFSLTTHTAMAAPPNYGYGAIGGTTHLVGLDGLCLDTAPFVTNYISTVLSPCELWKQSQLWTILEDGTIRSRNNRDCLAPESDTTGAIGTNVILRDCSKGRRNDKKWIKKKDGTIHHVESGLVLTGKSLGRDVALEINKDAPSQSWEATERLSQMVASIKWLENLCLQSREDSYVSLNECNREIMNQKWALYGDGTIRQNDNRNYCLTSSDRDAGSLVVVSICGDKPQQRWGLNAEDNTINHPSTNLVMDVNRKIELLPPIIVVDKRDGTPSQRWTIF